MAQSDTEPSEAVAAEAWGTLGSLGMEMSGELDVNRLVHLIVRAATRLSGATHGAFFERALTPDEREEVWRLYALDGAPEEAFTRFGLPRSTKLFTPTFRAEGIVRSDDVTSDPRYGSMGGMPPGHLPVRSYLATPVISPRGDKLGALLFGHPEPGRFSAETETLLVGFAAQAAAALDNAKLFRDVRQSDDRFRAAVEAIKGVLWTNDPQGRMVGPQPGWAALTGQSYDEYQGYGWSSAVHPEDAEPTVKEWEASVAERRPFVFEHRVRRADGRWGHFAIRAIPVLEPDGALREWVGVHTDITEQRSAEAALRASNEEMQRYTHMVGHDLRAPLVNIMGYTSELAQMRAQLLGAEADRPESPLTRDFDEALGFIRSSTERMDRLLAAILRLSREGRRALTPGDLDLEALVRRLFDAQHHQLSDAGATAEVGPMPPLHADASAVEQVLANLIDNAIKYRDPARPLKLRVEGGIVDGRVDIAVIDNGRGIAPVDRERAFQLFRRIGVHAAPGEGVGLAYVRALAHAMGGTIGLESEPGVGSRFVLSLPVAPGG